MPSSWNAIYPWIQSALITSQSPDDFCQQAIAQIAATYDAEGWLWIGIDDPSTLRVYRSHRDSSLGDPGWSWDEGFPLQRFQRPNGDLVLPLLHPMQPASPNQDRQTQGIALQLRRRSIPAAESDSSPSVVLTADQSRNAVYGWSADELESLEIVVRQVNLAYNLFLARQQTDQARQQISLLSRTAYLLNSNLPLDTQVTQLLNDWGFSIGSDRGFMLRRRDRILGSLATWNMDEVFRPPVQSAEGYESSLWQETIELFEEGAASHLEVYAPEGETVAEDLQQWLVSQGCRSGVLLPIHIRGQFLGIVGLLASVPRQPYRVDELQILRQAVEQLAIAVAGLYHPVEPLVGSWRQTDLQGDPLTGCETRAVLEQKLKQLPTQPEWGSTETSLVLCNLDYFKLVNDTYGYSVGDQVLRDVAQRLRSQLRHGTKVYRYGGEEFAILLGDTPKDAAIRVAERLRWAIGKPPLRTAFGEVSITASFGVAQLLPDHDPDAWSLLHRAESAVEQAKRQGRNQVVGQ